jgi:hypothetical protein
VIHIPTGKGYVQRAFISVRGVYGTSKPHNVGQRYLTMASSAATYSHAKSNLEWACWPLTPALRGSDLTAPKTLWPRVKTSSEAKKLSDKKPLQKAFWVEIGDEAFRIVRSIEHREIIEAPYY